MECIEEDFFFLNILLLEEVMRAAAIYLISGHIWERVLLKLGGD